MITPRPESLALLIKPTSWRCNLACPYCFYRRAGELYPDPSALMDEKTLEAVVKKALGIGAAYNVFTWQGGEPTLAGVGFFEEVLRLQERYRAPHQRVENTIQTNVTLIDESWCRFFARGNFLVGVSLDGPEDVHDRYRRSPSGEGSYSRVMEGITLMETHGVAFNIVTLLTDANVGRAEELYRFFKGKGFPFLQFINCFENDPETGRLETFSVRGAEVGEFYRTLFDLWIADGFPDVSIRLFEDILIYLIDGVHVSCCWMDRCASYLVVEHNGDCYPCDFFVDPAWRLGNLVDDDMATIRESPLRRRFSTLKSDLPEACRGCALLRFCNGDCTKFRGGSESASEYCEALKSLIHHMEPNLPRIREVVARIRSQ